MTRLGICFSAFLFCLLVMFSGCQARPTWQEQYDLGMRYLTESNYEQAILSLSEAIRINPEQANTYVYLVQAYLLDGRVEEAEQARLQGYEATGDARLSQSVLDGTIFYDESIPFEQQIYYREFNMLSTGQQDLIRQMMATIQAEDIQTTRQLLSDGVPPLLCTMMDGYRVVIMLLDNENYWAYYQSWLENQNKKGNQLVAKSELENLQSEIENLQCNSISFIPENGTSYIYTDTRFTLQQEDAEQPITSSTEEIRKVECQNWIGEGAMTVQAETQTKDGEGNFIVSHYESSGVMKNGVVISQSTKQKTPSEGETYQLIEWEYRNGDIVSYQMTVYENGERGLTTRTEFDEDGTATTYWGDKDTGEWVNAAEYIENLESMMGSYEF